jgi:glycosyltransferase involved in cell wall biosynthesis
VNAPARFDLEPGRPADVCLLIEGCYPHVAGGVSTWVDWLMRSQPERTFSVVSIVSGQEVRTSKYQPPANLIRFLELELQPRRRRGWPGGRRLTPAETEALVTAMTAFTRQGSLADLRRIMALIGGRHPIAIERLMDSQLNWALVCGMYRELMPHASFLAFHWAWRVLLGGLFATLTMPLPSARLYHAISTGYAGLLAARAAIETGRRTLVTEHGIYTNERRIEILMADWIIDQVDKGYALDDHRLDLRDLWIGTFESYARACYEACDGITTLYGDNQALQTGLGASPARLKVIPNGIDIESFGRLPRAGFSDPPTMALIGRVVPIKDVRCFIAAAAEVRKVIPRLRALVIGPLDEDAGYVASCRELVRDMELSETVTFTDRVKVHDWLPAIHVAVLTSLSEAQPLTLLECGAVGIPCVATDVGACREIIEGRADERPRLGAGGFVAGLVAPDEIAGYVVTLLRDPELRASMGERLQRRVRTYYASDMAREAYRSLYAGAPSAMAGS